MSTRYILKPVYLCVLLALCGQAALANPLNPVVVNGQASFATSGNTLTVTNTPGTIINWQGFSIAANEVTRFAQQSAASAVLNRVTSNNPSSILGSLLSNGRVFLINPGGIVFGAGATVDVAGLVASTLNLSNADFLAGNMHFTPVPGAANISNAGNLISQTGGQIFLIAPNVENTGVITAVNGEILLAAGYSVDLVSTTNPNLRVSITAPAGDATNVGQLVASAGSLGLFGTVVRNTGLVSADSVTSQGGTIVFKASSRVDAGGTVSARGAGGGTINLLADMQTGIVNVKGTLDASAPNGGNGGFIDTSAAHVQVENAAHVTTFAAYGNSGTWLIDPLDFTIAATGGNTTGAAVSASLLAGNVVIANSPAAGGNGDIFVNDAVSWNSSFSLTLNASRNINVNSPIINIGVGDVVLNAATGNIAVGATIRTAGFALLSAMQGAITDNNAAALNVAANGFEAWAANGINLDTDVNSILAINKATGDIVLREANGASLFNLWNGNPSGRITLTSATGTLTSAMTNSGVTNTIGVGGVVQFGQWTGSGGQSIVSPANPRYTFTTTGGMTEISLMSPRSSVGNQTPTDPWVYLLDSAGNLIASNDDGGVGYTSLIRTNLLPGTYTVVAATWAPNQTYPFALTIGTVPYGWGVPAVISSLISSIVSIPTFNLTAAPATDPNNPNNQAAQDTAAVIAAASRGASTESTPLPVCR